MDSAKRPERILVVDDTKANVHILVQTLRNDYKLGVATSGEKALEYVREHRPDLVLLDIMMPGIDGYEVCSRLKADDATRDIPIIFITALDQIHEKARGFDLGAIDYITKPFEIVEVKARVRTHLKIERYQRELQARNCELEQAQSRLRYQIGELEGIDRLVRYQMSATSLKAARREVVEVARTVLGTDQIALFAMGAENSSVELVAGEAATQTLMLQDNASPVALAASERALQADDGGGATPLLYGRELMGVLWAGPPQHKTVDDETRLQTLWRLAGEIAVVLNAAQMTEDLASGQLQVEQLLDMDNL